MNILNFFVKTLVLTSVLASNLASADTIPCEIIGAIGNLFNDFIADLGNVAVAGTSSDVPPPYEEFVVLNIQPPNFNGCNATIRIDIKFTSAVDPTFDSTGFADIQGRWDLNELFNLKFCIDGLRVDQIELSNEPELLEDFAEDYVNSKLNDPECKSLLGDDDDDDDEEDDEEDNETESEGGNEDVNEENVEEDVEENVEDTGDLPLD